MSRELQNRVSSLEAEVKRLNEKIVSIVAALTEPEPRVNQQGPRAMCPHCGEKPAYHLHVINCPARKGARV